LKILGLDPSLTNFGWAFYDTDTGTVGEKGLFKTGPRDLFVSRYITLREKLRELIRTHQPDRIGIESPVFGAMYSEGMYGLFLYSLEAIYQEGKDVVLFAPTQVKAHAFHLLKRPKGWKVDKGDMVEGAKLDSGVKGKWNHNVADAYWVAKAASRFWQFYDGTITTSELTVPEASQFNKIHTFTRGKKAGETEKSGIIHQEGDRFFIWSKRNTHG